MVNLRKFCISDEVFTGFEAMIDLDEVQSIDGIIKDILNKAIAALKENKFNNLVHILQNKASGFHVHDFSFCDILISRPTDVFYVCSHCKENVFI